MNPHLTRAALISAAAAAIFYLGVSLIAGWRGVLVAFGEVGWPALVAALALSLMNYGLRIVRWRLYLRALGARLDWETAEAIYLAGFAFTATPGKAGELLRGVFLANEGVSFLVATAAFVSERLSDLVGVILIALPGAATAPNGRAIVGLGAVIVATLAVGLSSRRALETLAVWIERLHLPLVGKARALIDLTSEARRCHDPAKLIVATSLSLAAWGCEAFAFYLVLARIGIEVGLGGAMSVYALSMLAGALSFLPGGLGGAEAVMMGLLVVAGAPQAKAVAATLVIRLATLWFAVAIGVAAMAIERRRLWPRGAEAVA